MGKPNLAKIETNVDAVLASYEKCEAGNCDGCAFEYIRRDWPAACAYYQQQSARYLLKKLAEQTPRVLSYNEASKNAWEYPDAPDSCTPVFVQFRSDTMTEIDCPPWRGGYNQRALLKQNHDGRANYGHDFVFWTGRPTREQMEAVQWVE